MKGIDVICWAFALFAAVIGIIALAYLLMQAISPSYTY